ncbi:centrosomal protein of 70 kDa isoform X1 [Alosa alosa]|uniref:centrosomal protein of 70 kDa isoform X1 n=1 Tax=Alosa alosa TaxID=278164 RepID=UPI0020153F6C|nr:centrosomal protein of 70 kDa isoform X1 [Alosa alosa]
MDFTSHNSIFQTRDRTYLYLWTYSQFQRELSEWDDINKLLQRHGFKPVQFADPVENKNLSDLVLLEKKAAGDIRTMLRTMLADSDRRQALIQELIQSNSQLKEEVQQHQSRAARHSQRALELEGVLDGVKGKVQDLEDRYISKASQQHSVFQQLQQHKTEAESRCEALEQKLSLEERQVEQLQRKLYYAVKEEERRVGRQNQAFQQIHKRTARTHSPTDQQILDVIDVYESQMEQMRNELKTLREPGESDTSNGQPERTSSDNSTNHKASDNSTNHKALLKSYQEQLRDTKAHREELRREIQQLKQDLDSRPTVKELKSYKQQLRRMDRIIQQTNLKSAQEPKTEETTEVENIDHMQASACRALLKSACVELGVHDVNHLLPALKSRPREANSTHLEKVLHDVSALLASPRAPLQLLRQRPSRQPLDQAFLPGELQGILPTLEVWREQLASLKELHHSLTKLVKRLLPWQVCEEHRPAAEGVKVEDLQLLVDTLLEETAPADKVLCSPTKNTLQSMVAHFQKLFDVHSLRGVYPRMNEVYTRLGEMTNAMRNLRDVLDLDEKAPSSEVVNQVARIASPTEDFTTQQVHSLLETNDIDSIILRLKEHEEFFPTFHSLVLELLQTLDVQRIDDIVPALRVLKSRVP